MIELYIVVSQDDSDAYDIPEAIAAGGAHRSESSAMEAAWQASHKAPTKIYKVVEVAYYKRRR